MFIAAVLAAALAQAPATYDAVTDRGPRAKPALVKLGPAGFSFNDPVFGSRIWRITDRLTRSDKADRSFRTPSATHQNVWSANASYFYVVSTDGTVVPFAFDAATATASRLNPLRFYIEPQFSYVNDSAIYGSLGGAGHTIDQFDFGTGQYTRLLDLATVAGGLDGTYVGGIASSAGVTERILAFFGGTSQDRHHYVVLFDKNAPQNRHVLDTAASTLDGRAAGATLNFHLHHAFIDRSGRYVMLYPTSADIAAPRSAAQVYVWDTAANAFTPMPVTSAHSGGHDAFGYGVAVNQDCCSSSTWDAAQWQWRSLAAPLAPRDVIDQVVMPKEVYLADHPSWNNARPDRAVPFVTGTYRYGADAVEWRPWDDEILAVPSDGGQDVWRLAHHRSDIRKDGAPGQTSFWYMPRPNVSQDGRWVLFTSNWEKTLGTDAGAPAGEQARQDVFLLQLKGIDDAEPPVEPPLTIATTALADGKVNRAYSLVLQASRPATWAVTGGTLPPGLSLAADGRISGSPRRAGAWSVAFTATDTSSSASAVFLLTVRR
jgi:hypothetical protein